MRTETFAASVAFGIARGWIRPPAFVPEPQKPTPKRRNPPYQGRERVGKNITTIRDWLAAQQMDRKFDYRDLHRETGVGIDACKYVLWALLQKSELKAIGKSGHYNTPMQYVRA